MIELSCDIEHLEFRDTILNSFGIHKEHPLNKKPVPLTRWIRGTGLNSFNNSVRTSLLLGPSCI